MSKPQLQICNKLFNDIQHFSKSSCRDGEHGELVVDSDGYDPDQVWWRGSHQHPHKGAFDDDDDIGGDYDYDDDVVVVIMIMKLVMVIHVLSAMRRWWWYFTFRVIDCLCIFIKSKNPKLKPNQIKTSLPGPCSNCFWASPSGRLCRQRPCHRSGQFNHDDDDNLRYIRFRWKKKKGATFESEVFFLPVKISMLESSLKFKCFAPLFWLLHIANNKNWELRCQMSLEAFLSSKGLIS